MVEQVSLMALKTNSEDSDMLCKALVYWANQRLSTGEKKMIAVGAAQLRVKESGYIFNFTYRFLVGRLEVIEMKSFEDANSFRDHLATSMGMDGAKSQIFNSVENN